MSLLNYIRGLLGFSLCLPKDEGDLGFRSFNDMSKALFAKIWWNYRTKNTLWTSFMKNKYCKKINEVLVPWRDGSHVWRKILQMRSSRASYLVAIEKW